MNGRNGIVLPGIPPQQPAALQVASPLNDIQLVALMAAQIMAGDLASGETRTTAAEAVAVSIDIIAQAFVQVPTLPAVVRKLQESADPG